MSGTSALYSRLFVLICAAVMSLIMCSHAARVSLTTPAGHNRVQRNGLRRLNTPQSHHHPLSARLLSTKNGLQTATKSETEIKGNFREIPSVINRQLHAVQYTQGYGQNNKGNGQFRVRSTQRGGMRPVSSIFTGHSQRGGQWQSGQNDYTLPQKEETENSYRSFVVIKRKSFLNKTASFSHTLDHKHNQKLNSERGVLTRDSSKVDEDRSVEKSFYHPLASPWINGNRNTAPSNPRGHYSGFKETNELPAGGTRSPSSGIQSVKVLQFTSHAAPHAASLGSRADDFVIKRQSSQEQWTPSNKDFSDRVSPGSSRERLGHSRIQSYLFKDPPIRLNAVMNDGGEASGGLTNAATLTLQQTTSGVQEQSRFTSNRLSRIDPNMQDADDGRKQSFIKYPSNIHSALHTTAPSSRQTSLHLASVEGKHLESFVPTSHEHSWDSHATSNKKVVSSAPVSTTTRDLVQDYKPGQVTKGSHHLRGFINPLQQLVKETSGSSPTKTTNSRQSSLDDNREFRFKNANLYPYLSQKYTFGQRGAFATTPAPAKQERMDFSPSSPAALNITQVTTTSPSFALGFKHSQHLLPEGDASIGRNPNQTRFKLYKGIFGLEGFGTQPLEGAKTLSQGPDTSVIPKRGFKTRSLLTWRPKGFRIQRWHSWKGERKPSSGNISTVSENELSSDDFKPLPNAAGSNGSVPGIITDENIGKGFPFIKNRTVHPENKTQWKYPISFPHVVSSAYLRSVGRVKVAPSQTLRSGAVGEVGEKGIPLKTSTSSIVRGKRVKLKTTSSKTLNGSLTIVTTNAVIVRGPKPPVGVKAVTYADIVGSASFSSVRATNQTANTEDYFLNMTTTEQKGGWTLKSDDGKNASRNPEENAETDDVFKRAEENKFREEVDTEIQTSDLFFDNEGSGSEGFSLSDVLSTITESQASGADLSELDYLRISTGNISFKSAEQSPLDR